jgi:hypothetical protein
MLDPYAPPEATPEAVVYEVGEPLGSTLTSGGLAILDMSVDEVQEVLLLREKNNRVSINDLFCLVLARNRKAVLITIALNMGEKLSPINFSKYYLNLTGNLIQSWDLYGYGFIYPPPGLLG